MIRRIYTENKEKPANMRILSRYDIEGVADAKIWEKCVKALFSNEAEHFTYDSLPESIGWALAVRPIPGQYNQRADSTAACIRAITGLSGITVETAQVYIFDKPLSGLEKKKIRRTLINPIE